MQEGPGTWTSCAAAELPCESDLGVTQVNSCRVTTIYANNELFFNVRVMLQRGKKVRMTQGGRKVRLMQCYGFPSETTTLKKQSADRRYAQYLRLRAITCGD